MAKDEDLLVQRVATVLSQFPECKDNDTALVFRVAGLYGASFAMDAEPSLLLPKTYRIKKVAKRVMEAGTHHVRT
jgi:hypothetical protein